MTWLCKENCSDCCGLITFPKTLVLSNMDLLQVTPIETHQIKGCAFNDQTFMITEDYKCVFLNRTTKRCVIYDRRPIVCRRFGTDKELLCPHLDMSGKPRTEKESKRVARYMDRLTQKKLDAAMTGTGKHNK